jgi:hypothetical protein
MKKASISTLEKAQKRNQSRSKSRSPKKDRPAEFPREETRSLKKKKELNHYTKDLQGVELMRKNSGLTDLSQDEEKFTFPTS